MSNSPNRATFAPGNIFSIEQLEVEVGEAPSGRGLWKLPLPAPDRPSLQAEGIHFAVVRADVNHPIRHCGRRIHSPVSGVVFVVRICETSLARGPSYGLSFSSTLGFWFQRPRL